MLEERRISAGQALDMLQTVAPRAWAKRMLAWHLFETVGFLEFSSGTLTEKMSAYDVLRLAAEGIHPEARPTIEVLARAKTCQAHEAVTWDVYEPDFPLAFPIEAILQIDHFDWEKGTAKGDLHHVMLINRESYEELSTQHREAWIEFDLGDLSFPLSMIEMLAPTATPPEEGLFSPKSAGIVERLAGPGRRRKHDWDGALLHLIGEAERNAIAPDPDAHGAQADVAKMLADWFANNGASIPANSQLQAKAKQVLQHIRAANPKE